MTVVTGAEAELPAAFVPSSIVPPAKSSRLAGRDAEVGDVGDARRSHAGQRTWSRR